MQNAPNTDNAFQVLQSRSGHVSLAGDSGKSLECSKPSPAGSVSQRACTFCGSRVVLYPIADALHLVHGPVGCASYTWDIRGSLSSGPQLHRMSFSTDLREQDVIRGGAGRLSEALKELISVHAPKAAFVYSTCIVGLIGDDVEAICRDAQAAFGIPVIPVHSEGFKGTKKDGYRAACDALARLIGTDPEASSPSKFSINILGDFNIAGELWVIKRYFAEMGIEVVSALTGDGRIAEIQRAHKATLNVVQCSGSMTPLAKHMKDTYGIPFVRVSFFGIEDTAQALYDVARHFGDDSIMERTRQLVMRETAAIRPELRSIRTTLEGRKAAIYVGGSFKAISLIKALRHLGVETVVVGSQTGSTDEYDAIKDMVSKDAIMVDDSNPRELSLFSRQKGADLFIGGVKERPIAYKLGMGFCDHNHERKTALAGFEGMIEFAREVQASLLSPVWKFVRRNGVEVASTNEAGQ